MIFFQGAVKGKWKTGRDCLILKLKKFTFLTPSLLFNNSQSLSWGGIGRVTQGSLTGKQNKGEFYLRVLDSRREGNQVRIPHSKMAALSDITLVWGLCCLLPGPSPIPVVCDALSEWNNKKLPFSFCSLPSFLGAVPALCYGDQKVHSQPALGMCGKQQQG